VGQLEEHLGVRLLVAAPTTFGETYLTRAVADDLKNSLT
jgi:hypothetical protein